MTSGRVLAWVLVAAAMVGLCVGSTTQTCEIIESYGLQCEEHTVTTSDGYILAIQRIPAAKKGAPVVFLQHGLTSAAMSWVLNLPDESLGFLLAARGYDVWFGNSRGNGVSMAAVHSTPADAAFWDFSWDDMAEYDLPASIDYVLAQTGRTNLSYIAISQGTCIAFSGFLNRTLASKINFFAALAPVAYVRHQRAVLLDILAHMDVGEILQVLGDREWATAKVVHDILPNACSIFPHLCQYVSSFVVGPSVNLNASREGYYLKYEPDPTSVKNMVHWTQGIRKDVYQRYDYGEAGNMKHYGQKDPPQYDLKTFPESIPVALFTGGEDYLADPADVQHLVDLLPRKPISVNFVANYSHIDSIMATNAHIIDYPTIYEHLHTYNPL